MRFKMTTEEKNWVLYDVGNSAFVLISINNYTDLF